MRSEFVYSLAALAAFPIVVNAQVEAVSVGKITAKKDGSAWTMEKDKDFVKGKYSFIGDASTGIAKKKVTITILKDGATLVSGNYEVGKAIKLDFTLDAAAKINVKVQGETADADYVISTSAIQLNYDFTKVAELLQIEYNKVTEVLGSAEYKEKASDAQTYSKLYDRIVAIANADYAFYTKDTDGVQALYDGNQTDVTGMSLYSEITDALADVTGKEKVYQLDLLDGDGGLKGLDARYDALGALYQTSALTAKKDAAKNARNAYDADATGDKLLAAKNAIAAYKAELEKEEAVKDTNEKAKKNIDDAWTAVYDKYYNEAVKKITEQYPDPRYTDLRGEALTALADIIAGEDKTNIDAAIDKAYTDKVADAKQTDLGVQIAEFKEQLTRTVADYNEVKEQLAAVFATYDAQDETATDLVKDAAGFLVDYKNDVLAAVADFLKFIGENDKFKTVKNLTDENVNAKLKAIADAEAAYKAQAAIYADFKALQAAVAAETTSLNNVKAAIDKDAKDSKKLDDAVFKPTTIWASTISAIEDNIADLGAAVDANATSADKYKTDKKYTDALKAIQNATAALNSNALAATAKYAEIAGQIKTADDLRKALLDPAKDPKVDLTALNVWTNQVTIDEAVKARTPYKSFINDGDGSITKAISALQTKLDAAPSKTTPLNDKKDNVTNILPYLNSLSNDVKAVTEGTQTMNDIKSNYTNDEKRFADQLDIQECDGIRTNINSKAVVFDPSIKALQKRINDGEFGNVKGAALQKEIDAITAKINAAKEVAAKADATKDELTKAYDSIKNLDTEDIKKAQDNAFAYAVAFKVFSDNYNLLNGTKDDASSKSTLFGLDKKVAEQQKVVSDLAKLSDAQKTTYKNNIAGVSVKKKEKVGDKDVDVTYTIASVKEDIAKAKGEEVLTDEVVTKYQGLIEDLKAATVTPVTQATRMNTLEDLLAAIDFNKAKADVLKADPNQDGFYYKQLTGQMTSDFNNLKGEIEADKDLGADEWKSDIAELKGEVEGVAAKADANLKAFNDAKDAYAKATNTYEEQYAVWNELNVKLDTQKAALETLKDALDELGSKAEANYKEGKSAAADKAAIVAKEDEIKNAVAEYTNPVNYNALVAKDNKATYDGITKAHEDADAAYATSSSIINTYKYFKSTELQTATKKAQTELNELLKFLTEYDDKVNALQNAAEADYEKVVSPEQFDKDKSYKKQFEDIQAELETLTKNLSDKINSYAAAEVATSVANYDGAITASKAKVAKFSDGDKDLDAAVITGLYAGIDAQLTAITDVKDIDAEIKTLDGALLTAETANTGIKDQITAVEQAQAQKALQSIITGYKNWGILSGNDLNSYYDILDAAYYNGAKCVANFASYKSTLNELKAKAQQIEKDNAAIAAAEAARTDAATALAGLQAAYPDFAAGHEVKATVEEIAKDLEAFNGDVTVGNAADVKTGTEAISARVAAVYPVLYDAELVVIEGGADEKGLIAKAKEENLTYGGDKAAMTTAINAQEANLKAAKDAVAANDKDPKTGKNRKAALTDLKNIETALNGFIKTMADANDTNLDGVIKESLDAKVAAQQTALDNSLNALYGYSVPSKLTDTWNAIQFDIDEVEAYIYAHADEMAAYQANAEAMLADIEPQINDLKAAAEAEKVKQDEAAAAAALANLNNTWGKSEQLIQNANNNFDLASKQLAQYGSAANYANKMAKLDEQIAGAEDILTKAKAEAETKKTTAEKQPIANKALTDVDVALNGVADNCSDIVTMAKNAYVDKFIDDLSAQIVADTWTASNNYTATDKKALTAKRDALVDFVSDLATNAKGKDKAEDDKDYKGVITTLNEGKTQFNNDLESLKKDIKDMSLVEDKRGHIANDGQNEEIGDDDLETLADIILNDEAYDAEACDVNGDGEVDVTDLVWLRYFLVHDDWPTVGAAVREMASGANDAVSMQVVSTNGNITRLAINLNNETAFKDFQVKLQLPAGAKVVGKSLGDRVEGVTLISSEAVQGTVNFVGLATTKGVINGEEGTVLYLDVENLNGAVTIGKAIFVDTSLNGHDLTSTSEATGIRETIANALDSATQKFYDVSGRMLNSLKNGINIIRNADGTSKKVLK